MKKTETIDMARPQKRAPFNVRLDQTEKAALEAAGKAEDRAASWIARRAIIAWLQTKGFLK